MTSRLRETKVLTPEEIESDLGFSHQTVVRMCRAGELPAYKIRNRWRVNADAYDQWKRAQEGGLTISRADQ
jgi:excisionase family DNA binding protein